jgi:hypothetical protein
VILIHETAQTTHLHVLRAVLAVNNALAQQHTLSPTNMQTKHRSSKKPDAPMRFITQQREKMFGATISACTTASRALGLALTAPPHTRQRRPTRKNAHPHKSGGARARAGCCRVKNAPPKTAGGGGHIQKRHHPGA